jgi:hypothetical protein
MSASRFPQRVAALVILLGLGPVGACSSDFSSPPAHIGVLESGVTERPGRCSERSEHWGCLEPGEKVILGFFQEETLIAQVPTRAGSNFRVELPPGRYQVRVIEPRGTFVSPASVSIRGGVVQRSRFLWPVDEESADLRRSTDEPGAGGQTPRLRPYGTA